MSADLCARYGQWTSYVRQLREGLAHAEHNLATAQTDAARMLARQRIEACRRILAEMHAMFPELGDDRNQG